ncbi:hypothetical protein [Escherichia sp. E4385]|uniref:hypothetical protein n=1 Tax=Escherichia sp. E4385 TaxID=2040639 RepID=UPI0010FDB299|nr:hypothetical protein [Escherichia sp. E4385]TLJ03245.1 hypothetical protein FEK49_06235 [Escherichia sp. E4385]
MKKIYSLLLTSFLLSGCTTEWKQTRYDAQDLSTAQYECGALAEEKYPVKNRIAERTVYEAHVEKCRRNKHCKKKYDSSPTVQSYVIDVNENTRYEWMERCMQQRGWVSEVKVLM